MRSIKAIIAGSAFIFIALLLMGLIYIFLAVGYNTLTPKFPFLSDITFLFRYFVGIPIFILIMFVGGYITASIANMHEKIKVLLHCLSVGLITLIITMYSSMKYSSLTSTGVVIIILSLSASSAGGLDWLRGNKRNSE